MREERPNVETVDEYIALFPSETQQRLEQIRSAIKEQIPKGEEFISYRIPAFRPARITGVAPIYMAAFSHHISMYPLPKLSGTDSFNEKLTQYQTGKGTLRFSLDQPLPLDFIESYIALRLQEYNR